MKILFFLLLTFTIWKGQSQDLLLRNVRILDFGKGEFSEPTQLLIQNGKIKAIRPRIKHTHSVDTLDLKGAYAIPGLIDAHVHLSNDPKESRTDRIRHQLSSRRSGIITFTKNGDITGNAPNQLAETLCTIAILLANTFRATPHPAMPGPRSISANNTPSVQFR